MQKLALLFLILASHLTFAQDLSRDLEFIETQNTQGSPFNMPLYIDLEGNLSLISRDPNASMSVGPLGHIAYRRYVSNYNKPIQSSEFSFSEQKTDLGWIEVKRFRWEIGLGIGASLASNFISVGLTPFKGARQVMIRQKETLEEKTPNPKLPDDLSEMADWKVGDRGSFQRYGGVQISVGAKFSFVQILTVGLTIQNLFSVVVNKIADKKIRLSIAEENLKKRRLQSGVSVANAKVHFFNGKRLTTHFTFDLNDPYHNQLYKLAIKGRLDILQEKLPQEAQKLEWKGSERIGYVGIPGVAGIHNQRSEYEMDIDDEHDVIDIKQKRSAGILIPLRNHNHIVYQTESGLILFWYSEMNKTDEEVLNRRFLAPGRIMGAKGFENTIPPGTKIGSTLSQMGMSFTREELEAVTPEMLEEIMGNFKQRCEDLDLECARAKKQRKIHKSLLEWMDKKWEDVRDKLGFLMIKEPALIYAYIKTIKSKKKVYFKFLNQKFQSMEGAAPIEI